MIGFIVKTKLAACIALVILTGCAKSSTGRNQITLFSDAELNTMGTQSFEEMKKKEKISTDKNVNDYVQCVAKSITKNVPQSAHKGAWEVVVFDSKQVNAFALPGGKIGVYTGILEVADTPDQLAAIIGHEVGHVIESHSNERLSANKLSQTGLAVASVALKTADVKEQGLYMQGLGLGLQYGVLMPYSRSHESEADIVGQDLMARSGYQPKASIELWQSMSELGGEKPPEFMSTHPSNKTRINQLSNHLSTSQKYYQKDNAPNCKVPK